MSRFTNLDEIIESLETDPSTATDPIKRQFLCDGEHMTANLGILEGRRNALHTQKSHDEVVFVLQGNVDFRVGEETKRVSPGDLIFIPRNTIHGPIMTEDDRFVALTVFAPYFDRSKKNIEWEEEGA